MTQATVSTSVDRVHTAGARKTATTTTTTTTTTATTPQDVSTELAELATTRSKYRHFAAYHSRIRPSCLSRDSTTNPSFIGFRNLMVIVLIVMNLRLVVENFMKYGVLICIKCHDYRRNDVFLGSILFALVPCHLFVAYIIELAAAQQAKGALGRKRKSDNVAVQTEKERRTFQATWRIIAFAHTVNATLCLAVTNFVVYYYVHHPGIGTICEFHAIIVWLKNCSYAFTNRDLRLAMLHPSEQQSSKLPEIYSTCPYPQNIRIGNLVYFWLAPTLVYQPVYPRTQHIRWGFVGKRLGEFVVLSVFIWLTSTQYAAPVLRNSLDKIAVLDFASIIERIMKLSTISLVIWLAGFYAFFQSLLNALAEIMRFGDREFYSDWWNSWGVGMYWRSWNKPVYLFMKRHIYSPLVGRGWSPFAASIMVFLFSAVLHELLVGIPTHNLIGVAFAGMLLQLPLITATMPLEQKDDATTRIIGNSVFWISNPLLIDCPLRMVSITLPDNYGAVIAIALGVIPVLSFVQGSVVGVLRKKAQVPYPHSYATVEQCKANPNAYRFNCAQRAHGNLLENMPQTIAYMLVAGLKWPNASAALGAAWVVSRALYAHGYITSTKPNGSGRHNGVTFWLCQGALWGMAVFGVGRELLSL
ncbi:hypothetical protein UA08_03663 [Talaromyces atroroseus]|uniref:diacylglycerol O-acyltransferase n=1 Tax=Talaromyces atroroseus TaxID=1441469 RepID=A0A225AUI3_TALAT|nr:hypothetical protein UA08_03663 [Talaromyces atroroseus]OKL60958.1 hypothetical protein UA08_03663 [Talaromyces atroroseus]